MEFTIELLEFHDFADKEVTVAMGHLRVGDVNHIIVDVEVQLKKKFY